MARLDREPSFLPLTVSTANSMAASAHTASLRASADMVRRKAYEAESAAAECWTALLAGCDGPGTRVLPRRLRELSEATSMFAGTRWWFGRGATHRERVDRAQERIEEAVAERDGEDFAEAFVDYDQAVATVLVRTHSRLESSAR
jgi:hypothetical protein